MFITYIRHKPTHSICGSAAEHPSECGASSRLLSMIKHSSVRTSLESSTRTPKKMPRRRKVPIRLKQKVITIYSQLSDLMLIVARIAQAKAAKDKANKADDPKAGADIGKIVNLMSSDTNRVSHLIKRTLNMLTPLCSLHG